LKKRREACLRFPIGFSIFLLATKGRIVLIEGSAWETGRIDSIARSWIVGEINGPSSSRRSHHTLSFIHWIESLKNEWREGGFIQIAKFNTSQWWNEIIVTPWFYIETVTVNTKPAKYFYLFIIGRIII